MYYLDTITRKKDGKLRIFDLTHKLCRHNLQIPDKTPYLAGKIALSANTTSIDHFGEALRGERQRRSVSLEDISQTTKVTVRSLRALESEAFDQLPGGILSKGIVRSYVRCLGLDEGEWVARFLDASGQKTETSQPAQNVANKDWAAFAINVSSTRVREITDSKLRWAGVVVLLLLLACFGWIVWGFVHQRVVSMSDVAPAHYSADMAPVAQPELVAPAVVHSERRGRAKSHAR